MTTFTQERQKEITTDHELEYLKEKFNLFRQVSEYVDRKQKEDAEQVKKEGMRKAMLKVEKKCVVVAELKVNTFRQHDGITTLSRFPERYSFMHTGVPVARKIATQVGVAPTKRKGTRKKQRKEEVEMRYGANVVALIDTLGTTERNCMVSERSRVHLIGKYEMEKEYELDVKRFLETGSLTDPPGSRRLVLANENLIIMLMIECGVISADLGKTIYRLFEAKTKSVIVLRDDEGMHCLIWEGVRSGVYDVFFSEPAREDNAI